MPNRKFPDSRRGSSRTLGARIRYLAGGSGPPVVLVHGLGGTTSNWRLIAPALARERRVLVPDLPGHGRSGPLGGATSLDPFAEVVLAVLERGGGAAGRLGRALARRPRRAARRRAAARRR